ncbi:hypothetical protein MTR67_008339 [Solanum verrucosum]|uniref:Glycosyl transferase 48 domain-containing protein n=1 Tax=Solanum verrucosum TaxID=315347 RepID=A0AAF0Q195_SOLVR|nr:hypothetical protein MTR67_008339 [Solanum verrucosum]
MSGGGGYLGGGGSMDQRHRGETYKGKGKGKDDCDDFLWPVIEDFNLDPYFKTEEKGNENAAKVIEEALSKIKRFRLLLTVKDKALNIYTNQLEGFAFLKKIFPVRGMMYCRKPFLDMAEDEGSIPRKASRSTKYWKGKPKNQNHSIIFRRGEALQTIGMNQDNYLEEALKMRNILQEILKDSVRRTPTILGMREHIFTGSFGTISQRLLANPVSRKDATSTSKSTMEKMHKKRGGQVGGGSDKGLGRDL